MAFKVPHCCALPPPPRTALRKVLEGPCRALLNALLAREALQDIDDTAHSPGTCQRFPQIVCAAAKRCGEKSRFRRLQHPTAAVSP